MHFKVTLIILYTELRIRTEKYMDFNYIKKQHLILIVVIVTDCRDFNRIIRCF